MDLTQMILELKNNTSQLLERWATQNDKWDKQVNDAVNKAKTKVDSFIAGARKEYPITPNLLKNTRFFKWKDEVIDSDHPFGSKDNQWFDNTLPLFWGWYNYKDHGGQRRRYFFQSKNHSCKEYLSMER